MSIPKDNPSQARFWDRFVTEEFKTVDNFKAKFGPTEGGGSNSWPNRRVKISAQITDREDKVFIKDIAVFYISKVLTSSDDNNATLQLHALHKPLQKANAEKIKNSGQWWENVPISFLINKLLEFVYKGPDGMLPEEYMVSRQDLSSELAQEDLRYWNLGVPPNWDGQTFTPSINANPITSMIDIPESDNIVVGLGGFNGYKAELWIYNTTEDTWSFIASNEDFEGPIQSLTYNPHDGLVYGVCWQDKASDVSSIEASNLEWIAPEAKLFWRNPLLIEAEYLDDNSKSTTIPNLFPGQWEIREMFPLDSDSSLPYNTKTPGESQSFDKSDFKASVGNFEGIEHIRASLPLPYFGDVDRFPLVKNKNFDYEKETYGGELFPRGDYKLTEQAVTTWLEPAEDNVSYFNDDIILTSTGWSNPDVTNNIFSISMGASLVIKSKDVDPTFNYRIYVEGFGCSSTDEVEFYIVGHYVDTQGTIIDNTQLTPSISINEADGFHFVQCPVIDGHQGTFNLAIMIFNGTGDYPTVTMGDISFTTCTHWKLDEYVDLQAGENIPITHYSKIVAGVYNNKATNAGDTGPKYNFFNDRIGSPFQVRDLKLESVFFLSGQSSDVGWVTDDNGHIYRTTDGGESWNDSGNTVQSRKIFSSHFFNANVGFIVGESKDGDSSLHKSENASSANPSWIQKSIDGLSRDVYKIRFLDSNNGWLVGAKGNVFQTQDGGTSWFPRLSDSKESMRDLHIFNSTSVIVCRDARNHALVTYKTTDSGGSWDKVEVPVFYPVSGESLIGISFIDDDTGYLGGNLLTYTTYNQRIGTRFEIWKTTNGGDSWVKFSEVATISNNYRMTDFRFLNSTLGLFCTSHGHIYLYNPSNDEFDLVYNDTQDRAFREIFIKDSNNIIIVGHGSLMAVSEDGGNNWEVTGEGWRAEEVSLDFNLIAQNRKKLSKDKLGAFNPLYGPSGGEKGISSDNSIRNLIAHSFDFDLPVNDVVIKDLAPSFNYVEKKSQAWVGNSSLFANDEDFRTGEAGNGYLSVIARAIGNRAGDPDNSLRPLKGIVRYTNGQEGFFELAKTANQGKGVILFCQDKSDNPGVNSRYRWGPGGDNNRFKTKLVAFDCETKATHDIMDLETNYSPNPNTLYDESTQTLTPIAGAVNGAKVYISLVANPTYTKKFNGGNEHEITGPNFIYEVDLKEGSFSVNNIDTKTIYDSRKDQSLYNTRNNEEGELIFSGNVNNTYASLNQTDEPGPQNRSRKITHLFYSQYYGKLFGSGFRKDSLLSTSNEQGLTVPCHEVFYLNPDYDNQLIIVDHDVQDGINADSIKFTGFSEHQDRLWYFRLSCPTINPHRYYNLGKGVRVNYYTEENGIREGGLFWDEKSIANSRTLKEDQRFISHNQSITSLVSPNQEIERNTIFSSFDYYFRRGDLSQQTLDEIVGRPRLFFKLDSYGLDRRIELADFSDLKVWDAIQKLANAHNLVFGFNRDKFFVTPRDKTLKTISLNSLKGDIKSINKEVSDDIHNIVSASAYSPQLKEVEWEVSHVGSDDRNRAHDLEDDRLFNGELSVNINTDEVSKITMICTKRGRLLTAGFDEESSEIGDANDDIWDSAFRNPPLFKWLTHLPSVEVVLMQTLSSDERQLLLNTTYQGSPRAIQRGDILIFTDQETLEPVGKLIEEIDFVQNRIILEEPLGFSVEKFSNLSIIRANTGSDTSGPPNFNSTVTEWGKKYSDEGLAVIKDIRRGRIAGGKPSNKVIQIKSFTYLPSSRLVSFIFEKNHELSKGDSFTITKTGDPDFDWAGEYTVSEASDRSVRSLVNIEDTHGSFSNFNKKVEVYLRTDTFETPMSGTIIRLNNLNSFRGVRIKPYGQDYKHFNFLITTLQSESLSRTSLPNTNKEVDEIVNVPIAYIHGIDFNSMEIDLGPGDYSDVFQKGDVINGHYIMSPTADKHDIPPYMGLSQTLPGGLGNWRWIAEADTDLFNVGDIIKLNFPGKKLSKDSSSMYTLSNTKSIRRWGEHEHTIPDNRFIEHEDAMEIVRRVIKDFAEPGLDLTISLPYRPDIGFVTLNDQDLQEIEVIDPQMFGSMPGFKVSGVVKSHELDLGRKIMEIKITSKQKY